ncbi:MBL fold metallo-hydrolase [Desulfatibacillum aliphaticivorans]|uniref:MBL fold metallo-hydrolase n=1 Tax=Desulfatibacillum aliphaticivorans TaxID=218208 RepID=UPI000423F3A9|nr:MBL fold metallo-hydrolase [Desulfatibacillum aliphaticivorans]
MEPQRITPELTLIPLDQPTLRGFHTFISAWLYQGDATFLVDPGPASTVPLLVQTLEKMNVTRLDALLLTHIHIDHAGGAGDFSRRFPDTPVVCHPKAIPHMADPERLWQGSLKTLGDTARAYGQIQPVPEKNLVSSEDFADLGVQVINTPGHAVHHISYLKDDILFAGETGGVRYEVPGKGVWIRPATPPRFLMEISCGSMDALMETPHDIYCYGHYGAVKGAGASLLAAHKDQVRLWAGVIEREMAVSSEDLEERCLKSLLAQDPGLSLHPHLPDDVREREKGFMFNSIRGIAGYLRDRRNAAAQ